MKTKTLISILCLCVFLFSFSNKEKTIQTSNNNSNIVKSLVQTTDYLRLQVNSPMKLAEYTANKNNKEGFIKSISKDIIFIPNKGQIIDTEGKLRPDILYKAELNGVDLYLTKKGMSFVFYTYEDIPNNIAAGNKEMDRIHDLFDDEMKNKIVKMYRMDLDIVGMNTNVRTLNEKQTTEYSNYYYAHCPDGITNVHGFRKVIFKNVYNNIDLVYYSNEKGLKYDFIVKPGGDVKDIKLKYKNEDEVYITNEGKVRATNPFGVLETDVLYTYQSDGKVIGSNYIKEPNGTIKIYTRDYDKIKKLIIDPYIGATYYGGSNDDYGNSITTDGNNNILITGDTYSSDFPVYDPGGGAYFQSYSYYDSFILKLSSSGISQWATFYGGGHIEYTNSITANGNNNILITGVTVSSDFPTYNPGGGIYYQGTLEGIFDAFILKFNLNGVRQWATYYGGNSHDEGHSIITDGNNNILVTGFTNSTDFPIQNPGGGAYFQNTNDGYVAFILKFNSNGVRQWATYYGGGTGTEQGKSITTDGNDNILITGISHSLDFPLYDPGGGAYFQGYRAGSWDIILLKFNSLGVRKWATYYGGTDGDHGNSITTDGNNSILVAGGTNSLDFPLYNPGGGAYYQSTYGGGTSDAFILKFDSNCIRQWATYYGGNWFDNIPSIYTNGNNDILITGDTYSTVFPLFNPGGGVYFQGIVTFSPDAFILKFNSNGVRQWATFYGGNGGDEGNSIITDENNNILITGITSSTIFPLLNPGGGAYYQGSFAGGTDVFILGFDSSGIGGGLVNINALSTSFPDDYKLYQNYPNPFNPTTNVRFDIRESSQTKLIVYNILGKEIATLVNEKLNAGSYEVSWDGAGYPSGIYFYKLVTDEFSDVKKMVLVK